MTRAGEGEAAGTSGPSALFVGMLERLDTGIFTAIKGANRRRFCRDEGRTTRAHTAGAPW
jgi:hypothetical protein